MAAVPREGDAVPRMLPEWGQGSGVDVSHSPCEGPCWQQGSHLDVSAGAPVAARGAMGAVLGEAPEHWCKVLLNRLLINGGLWFYFLVVACVSPRWHDPVLALEVLAAFGPIFVGFRKGVCGSSSPCTRWQQLSSPGSIPAAQRPQPPLPGTASSTDCLSTGTGIWEAGGSLLTFSPLPHYPVPACPSLPARLLPPQRLPLPGPCEALQETKTEPN